MTTTTNKPQLVRVDKPADAKGPIETLIEQRVKLEKALEWAKKHVEYKEETLQKAIQRRDEIKRDLVLTDQIIAQHAPDPRIEILVHNTMQGVVPAASFADRLRATRSVVD